MITQIIDDKLREFQRRLKSHGWFVSKRQKLNGYQVGDKVRCQYGFRGQCFNAEIVTLMRKKATHEIGVCIRKIGQEGLQLIGLDELVRKIDG